MFTGLASIYVTSFSNIPYWSNSDGLKNRGKYTSENIHQCCGEVLYHSTKWQIFLNNFTNSSSFLRLSIKPVLLWLIFSFCIERTLIWLITWFGIKNKKELTVFLFSLKICFFSSTSDGLYYICLVIYRWFSIRFCLGLRLGIPNE